MVVPVLTPVTVPDDEPMFTLALLLLHTPPVLPLVNVVVLPMHTVDAPTIAVGKAFTVTVFVL